MTQTEKSASTPGQFQNRLASGFAVTVEIPPPKSANPEKNLKVARAIAGKVAGINVTDNQRGMMRMSPLAFSRLLVQEGAEPLLQVCCRDRNRLALESDLLGASALGIKNLCVMTGDFTTLGNRPGARPVYDLDSVQLIRMAAMLTEGKDGAGKALKTSVPFFIGAVVNPFYEPMELELLKVRKKIAAGARFFQTQPFFDTAAVDLFLDRVGGFDAKFLIGVTPLKSPEMIRFLNDNVLTTPIPEAVGRRVSEAADPAAEGFAVAAEFINEIRSRVDGVHIMPIGQIARLPELLGLIGDGGG